MSTANPEPLGLRERKKAHMRHTLTETALHLFHENGYARTTTEEIAAGAGVSQRTFFRYFASKEAVVLETAEAVDELLFETLLARHADEQPFLALRNALRDQWEHLEQESLQYQGNVANLIATDADLFLANTRFSSSRQERLARVLAERTGVDPDTDSRPWLVAGVFFAALNIGYRVWADVKNPGGEQLLRCFLRQLDLVPDAICSSWRPTEELSGND